MIKPAHGFFKIGNDDLAHAQHGLGGRSALFLVYTTDQRQHRFGERELRATVDPAKAAALEHKRVEHHLTGLPGARLGEAVERLDPRVGEDRGVELGGFLRVVVKPGAGVIAGIGASLASSSSPGSTQVRPENHRGSALTSIRIRF
ncbi:hypothetical protein AWC32_01590 [Mycobacterium xenopi]|nr:hypothetical protein AWC32_01590 [Mycobacterium xenopi]